MKHALVIGGSGMLSDVALWLACNGYRVSVIGRSKSTLNKLREQNKQIIPVSVNYYDTNRFMKKIRLSVSNNGPFSVVVAWIHTNYRSVIDVIDLENSKVTTGLWRIYHVLGSSDKIEEISFNFNENKNYEYHQIHLGFVIDGNNSR